MMGTEKNNLELWNRVQDVDLDHTKKVQVAGKPAFTNIDSYELIRMATDEFGPYGKGFGIKSMEWSEKEIGDTMLQFLDAVFFYEDTEFPIRNSLKLAYRTQQGYVKIDEDCAKKLMTNTVAKALSYIGFGASVFLGKFEDQAYIDEKLQERVEIITPAEVGKLLKGITYYGADKQKILQEYKISHLKDLPKKKLNECEALIKKIATQNKDKIEDKKEG